VHLLSRVTPSTHPCNQNNKVQQLLFKQKEAQGGGEHNKKDKEQEETYSPLIYFLQKYLNKNNQLMR